MKSWRTTLFGVGLLLLAVGGALKALCDGDSATVFSVEAFCGEVAAGLALICARDNNKSSENVGAK